MFSEPKVIEGGPNGKREVTLKEVQCSLSLFLSF